MSWMSAPVGLTLSCYCLGRPRNAIQDPFLTAPHSDEVPTAVCHCDGNVDLVLRRSLWVLRARSRHATRHRSTGHPQ
jgi:hypothetical protein